MRLGVDYIRAVLLGLVCVGGLACTSGNEGATCGGFAGVKCAADEYCDYANNSCGAADEPGTCKRRPEVCTDIYSPVCACDGKTYGNECDAARNGVDVSAGGGC